MHLSVLCQNLALLWKHFIFDKPSCQPNLTASFICKSATDNDNRQIHTKVCVNFLAWTCIYWRMTNTLDNCCFDNSSSDKVGNSAPFAGWYSAKWRNNSSWFSRWQLWEWLHPWTPSSQMLSEVGNTFNTCNQRERGRQRRPITVEEY